MEISEAKFAELCRASQRLETLEDYLIENATRGKSYISLDLAAALIDLTQAYNQACGYAKEDADDAKQRMGEQSGDGAQ